MPLNPGTVINNRYRIAKLLGEGGFGAVYRAWDTNFEMACALKENYETTSEAQRQFLREAQILHNLRHPNLPLVKDHFIIPGQGQYLVMDFIQGQDLQEMISQAGGPLPESQVLPWILQICDALTYMHTQPQPVIHRDIKPANIKITPEGKAVLVDFGIAKVFDPHRKTTMGARAVTPGYSPFEQYGSAPTDARTDIYALGATAYALLTGQEPTESIARMAGADLTPPGQLNPAISASTERALLKALETMPAGRFKTAAEFKAALTPAFIPETQGLTPQETIFTSTEPILGRPPSQPPITPAQRPPSQPPVYQPTQITNQSAPFAPAVQVLPRQPSRPIPWKWIFGIAGGALILLCVLTAAIVLPKLLNPTATVSPVAGGIEVPTHTPRPSITYTPEPSPLGPTETPTLTPVPTDTPIPQPTSTATYPPESRTLVICMGQEPDTLYIYGGNMLADASVQQAIYDGPIDTNTFAYQPVILEKLPNLADGDAVVQTVRVIAGDTVVDDAGNPATLTATAGGTTGTRVRPAGCRSPDCSVVYNGTNVTEMDQIVVTFKLLPGLLWSDGTPLTSADSIYSFQLAGDPDSPVATRYTWDRTASYEAPDDLTNVWSGLPGYMDSVYFTNFWQPLPQHIMSQYSAADLVTQFDAQGLWLGWGPYVIDDWIKGQQITAHRNLNYFRRGEGLPLFSDLVFRFTGGDANAAIAAILSGECDIVDQTTALDSQSQQLLELQAQGQINATFITGTTWEHADFNIRPVASIINSGVFSGWDQDGNGDGPFGDVRLRQAVAMCMDRQSVVDTALYGQSVVIDTYLPPNHPLFNPNARHWPYDPAAAAALLDQIGWLDPDGYPATPRVASGVTGVPDGTRLSFNYETTTAVLRQQVTQILAQNLAGCGIEVTLSYHPSSEWFATGPDARLYGRLFDLGEFAWLTSVTPPCDLYLSTQLPTADNGWSGQNMTGFHNPSYDNVCSQQLQSLPGEAAYNTSAREAQRIFAEQLPVVPLFLRLKLAATRPDMCGFIMDPTNNSEMWNIEKFGYGTLCP